MVMDPSGVERTLLIITGGSNLEVHAGFIRLLRGGSKPPPLKYLPVD